MDRYVQRGFFQPSMVVTSVPQGSGRASGLEPRFGDYRRKRQRRAEDHAAQHDSLSQATDYADGRVQVCKDKFGDARDCPYAAIERSQMLRTVSLRGAALTMRLNNTWFNEMCEDTQTPPTLGKNKQWTSRVLGG